MITVPACLQHYRLQLSITTVVALMPRERLNEILVKCVIWGLFLPSRSLSWDEIATVWESISAQLYVVVNELWYFQHTLYYSGQRHEASQFVQWLLEIWIHGCKVNDRLKFACKVSYSSGFDSNSYCLEVIYIGQLDIVPLRLSVSRTTCHTSHTVLKEATKGTYNLDEIRLYKGRSF